MFLYPFFYTFYNWEAGSPNTVSVAEPDVLLPIFHSEPTDTSIAGEEIEK